MQGYCNRLILLIFTIFGSNSASHVQLEAVNARADELFIQGSYEKAFFCYEQSAEKSCQDCYRMAVCCEKRGHITQALAYYYRAERLWPLGIDRCLVLDALTRLEKELHGKDRQGVFYIVRYACSLWTAVPLVVWQLLFLSCFALFLVACSRVWWKHRPFVFTLFVLFVGITGFCVLQRYRRDAQCFAIVARATGLRAGPGDFPICAETPAGLVVAALEKNDDFWKISGKKYKGWLSHEDLLFL